MSYKNLYACIVDLEKNGLLKRIREPIDADLEMAAVHRRVVQQNGPALFFENIKNAKFPAVSNLFGTYERSRFIFRKSWTSMLAIIQAKKDPQSLLNPIRFFKASRVALHALPRRELRFLHPRRTVNCAALPQIRAWPKDAGSFVTLPLVYTENPDSPGVMHSNLGMYRVQLNGNRYEPGITAGMHYQLHRGIGIHHHAAIQKNQPLPVTLMVGGPPALIFSAVMPLPDQLAEVLFAGMLNRRAFCYSRRGSHIESSQVDFIFHGWIHPHETLPEGPFGDHLGYYSLTHEFPVFHIQRITAKPKAIWPFTVVGRPPQEDSQFGRLIHELTGDLISTEISGVHEVNAVDCAGVHPLLLAIGSERYAPYLKRKPRELLTQANAILGFNQMSLAKYVLIAAREDDPDLHSTDHEKFFTHILERIRFDLDLHFYTRTTMDTLDYSGNALNEGSKLVIATAGEKLRELTRELPARLFSRYSFREVKLVSPGIVALKTHPFKDYRMAETDIRQIRSAAHSAIDHGIALTVLVDDPQFVAQSFANFLWVTFTRSDPARDVYGVDERIEQKHWSCRGPIIIDARAKHHHAGELQEDPKVSERINRFFSRDASLAGF